MLEKINSPKDIKQLNSKELSDLSEEIRETIISCVSESEGGGHLASNLGMVEASIALHRVFDCPRDSIVFDVGHQCYAHKLLTGRYKDFPTIRTTGGISGFTNRDESEYDVLTAGHSGSALPIALGIARANAMNKNDGCAVAVIGDGSFTNGMVYETLNSCADKGLRLTILLNDNEMSISKNVGGMPRYFSRLRTSRRYFKLKKHIQSACHRIPLIGDALVMGVYHVKEFFKHLLLRTNMFESMGLYYLGPVDGNDEAKLESVLREAKTKDNCTLVHMITLKGKGYEPAEKFPDKFHFAGGFDPATGAFPASKRTFSTVFGSHLCSLALNDPDITAVTAAMDKGTGLSAFRQMFPQRFFDVGIAEECAVTFSGGLAAGGKTPVCALYSTFLQRAYDQLCEDVAMQKTHVVIAIDRAGIVPGDGITHQGIFDVSLLSDIPGVTLYSPETYDELKDSLEKCISGKGLCALRYPKGTEAQYDRSSFRICGDGVAVSDDFCDGEADAVILTYGRMTENAYKTAKMLSGKFNIRVVKLVKLLPADKDAVMAQCAGAGLVYVLEEGMKHGGVGECFAADAAERGAGPVFIRAIEGFLSHGDIKGLMRLCGFMPEQVAQELSALILQNGGTEKRNFG